MIRINRKSLVVTRLSVGGILNGILLAEMKMQFFILTFMTEIQAVKMYFHGRRISYLINFTDGRVYEAFHAMKWKIEVGMPKNSLDKNIVPITAPFLCYKGAA